MITRAKGCYDFYGEEAKKMLYINHLIDMLMEKYHYSFIRTPLFESSELFHRGIGESSDIVTKETYDFKDRGDRDLTLRPEGTAGVVRSYIENKIYGEELPSKFYYNGTMYRYERPQSGRDRELTQFGCELLGSDDPMADAEIISIPYQLFTMLGLKKVKVNLNTLGDEQSRNAYRKALIDYFTKYKEDLCDDCKMRLEKNPLRILDCKVDGDKEYFKGAPKILDYLNEESRTRFKKVQKYLDILSIPYEVNPSIVRGLDYYTHTVFEIEAEVEGFGSQNVLGAGGRYNNLVEELGGPSTPCVGFAAGLGRIMLALEKEKISLPINNAVDVFIMYVNEEEKDYALYLTQALRLSGFSVDTEYTSRSLKSQFKQADRMNSKFLIILNSEDLDENMVNVKNNVTKEEQKIELDYLSYYLDEQLADDEECDDACECNHTDCHCHGECDNNNTCDCGCHCDDDCNCGCQENEECTCDGECHCHKD